MDFREAIIHELQKRGAHDVHLDIPPPGMGDFAFPCFSLSRNFKKNPAEIAAHLAREIRLPFIERIEAKGPYLNFFIRKEAVVQRAVAQSVRPAKRNGRVLMVEYCAPNTNKPLHLGHLRNICIGRAVSNLLKHQGYKVIQANLVNDRGIHICQSMLAYQKWGKGRKPNQKPDHFVGEFYVMYQQKKDEALEKEAYNLLQKYEQGDKKTIALWKRMNRWALDGFSQTFSEFGVRFDRTYYESAYYRQAKERVLQYYKKGVFKMDAAGNIIVELEKFQLPYRVLLRDDGTSVYITQDIELAFRKFSDYPLEKSIYVVASEQNLHFQQLFAVLGMMGMDREKLHHLSYGLVNLPEGRMKSREGKVVDADDIIAELETLAGEEIRKRHQLPDKELAERSKAIGLAALTFYMLRFDHLRDITYNPAESIAFEGETGPYIQYTHARICSILRKQGKRSKMPRKLAGVSPDEAGIALLLLNFPGVVEKASQEYKPALLCTYLLQLCQAFNSYYVHFPILKAEQPVRETRLALARQVKETVAAGLSLLGIAALEEM